MKYVYRTFRERNGEYEYTHKGVHELDDNVNINKFLDDYISQWYYLCPKGRKEDGGYYFNGGEVWIGVSNYKEITKEEYDILKKYIY